AGYVGRARRRRELDRRRNSATSLPQHARPHGLSGAVGCTGRVAYVKCVGKTRPHYTQWDFRSFERDWPQAGGASGRLSAILSANDANNLSMCMDRSLCAKRSCAIYTLPQGSCERMPASASHAAALAFPWHAMHFLKRGLLLKSSRVRTC